MAELSYDYEQVRVRGRTDWGAIWAGVFTFLAIWSVFGALGLAIFASAASPNAANPVGGMGVGMGIWAIVLTIIAMYIAGRETGRLAAVTNRHDGLSHGMIMFGLSVVAAIVLTSVAGSTMASGTAGNAPAHSGYTLGVVADLGWAGFIALFLGWLGALVGASTGVTRKPAAVPQQIRPAA